MGERERKEKKWKFNIFYINNNEIGKKFIICKYETVICDKALISDKKFHYHHHFFFNFIKKKGKRRGQKWKEEDVGEFEGLKKFLTHSIIMINYP